jgi:CHASE2 domain-containing sensor protein
MNRTAAIIAGIYCLITSGIALRTALDPRPGFGALKHMFTFFATAPISVPLSILGMEPNFSRPSTVVLVILAATAVVYGLVALITWIFGKF